MFSFRAGLCQAVSIYHLVIWLIQIEISLTHLMISLIHSVILLNEIAISLNRGLQNDSAIPKYLN